MGTKLRDVSMEHLFCRHEGERNLGKVACVVPRGQRQRPSYDVHACLGTVWESVQKREMILSRAHPKLCYRLRMIF